MFLSIFYMLLIMAFPLCYFFLFMEAPFSINIGMYSSLYVFLHNSCNTVLPSLLTEFILTMKNIINSNEKKNLILEIYYLNNKLKIFFM